MSTPGLSLVSRQLTKDVPIGDHRYQVGLLPAADGSWVRNLLIDKMRDARRRNPVPVGAPEPDDPNAPKLTKEEGFRMTAQFLVSSLDREELQEVTTCCLLQCRRYEGKGVAVVPMPILAAPGRWGVADLEYDGPTVAQLVEESIAFNIAPFFTKAGSDETSNPASNQPGIPA